uniref:Uncharacterized protein n=1 Tax=Trichuris muris TaxID=70415 RepID=A0A5S6QRY6_TRIMR
MVLQHCRDRDYVGWWCNGKHCQKELSAKTGTWFQGCEQPVRTMLLFKRAWSESLTTLKFIFVRERRFAAVVQVGTKENVQLGIAKQAALSLNGLRRRKLSQENSELSAALPYSIIQSINGYCSAPAATYASKSAG